MKKRNGDSYEYEEDVLNRQWEKYRGSIVMVVGDKVFSAKRGGTVERLVKDIEEKYHRRPLITYVPKEGTLILLS